MHEYLKWDEVNIGDDFSEEKVAEMYDKGYVFTRTGVGEMIRTRSLRVNLSKFEPTSENRRIIKKMNNVEITPLELPLGNHPTDSGQGYNWEIGKLAKSFYSEKFGDKTFSANKAKELLATEHNFNTLFRYNLDGEVLGYCIALFAGDILHYSYPFYDLDAATGDLKSLGLGMMTMTVLLAKEGGDKYMYLGSATRPTDTYKLQFKGLEWSDKGSGWSDNIDRLKQAL